MEIGIVVPMTESDGPGAGAWPRIRTVVQYAEAGGVNSVWVYDHLIFRTPDEPEDGIHEAFTLLTAIAATTERVKIGSIVFATSFRIPAVFAKMVATADAVSGGRLILGLGCGWHEPEYQAFGIPFDSRVGRFEESLAVILPLLRGERVTFHGRWVDAQDAVLIPPPTRPGAMPILIAAKGERMLRLTARHADAWNTAWFGMPDKRFGERHAAIRAACEEEGRDPATLQVTVGITMDAAGVEWRPGAPGPLPGDPETLARAFDAWRDAGVGHLIVDMRPAEERTIDIVLDAVRRHQGG